ncbi:MAG: hypothetical protein IJJ01_07495 [Firmicutes bacterium]|nr:hypothetical protein [Bacillota bacterium]
MTRTFKYAELRKRLDKERTDLGNKCLDLSEDLSMIHSEVDRRAFDRMMGDPLAHLDSMLGMLKKKSFLEVQNADK